MMGVRVLHCTLLALLLALTITPTGAVVGGLPVQRGYYPWLGAREFDQEELKDGKIWLCAATLILPQWAVANAACEWQEGQTIAFNILNRQYAKDNNNEPDLERATVFKVYDHPSFEPEYGNANDITLLKLDRGLTSKTAKIPNPLEFSELVASGRNTILAGWGFKSELIRRYEDVLMSISIPIITNEKCGDKTHYGRYPYYIPNTMLCAGDTVDGGVDGCDGDQGSPLFTLEESVRSTDGTRNFEATIMGLYSWGDGFTCGQPESPGVYTSVSAFYEWIVSTLRFATFREDWDTLDYFVPLSDVAAILAYLPSEDCRLCVAQAEEDPYCIFTWDNTCAAYSRWSCYTTCYSELIESNALPEVTDECLKCVAQEYDPECTVSNWDYKCKDFTKTGFCGYKCSAQNGYAGEFTKGECTDCQLKMKQWCEDNDFTGCEVPTEFMCDSPCDLLKRG